MILSKKTAGLYGIVMILLKISVIARLPDENTILRFGYTLGQNSFGAQILAAENAKLNDRELMRKTGKVEDATIIAAPSSTNYEKGEHGQEMHQTQKGR